MPLSSSHLSTTPKPTEGYSYSECAGFEQSMRLNGSTPNSTSMDIACKNCFTDFDTVACIRSGALALLAFVTCVVCVVRVGRLHWVRHPQVHQYLIFYFAVVECLLCGVNWTLGGFYPQFDFAANYLKLLEFVVICHFHWCLAARIIQKESVLDYVIKPLVGAYVIYFTVVAAFGMVDVASSWTQCMKPYWVMLSSGDFIIIQLFTVAGYFITVKINSVSSSEAMKRTQKRDLWSLIFAFELSALLPFAYDLCIMILGDESIGCSGIFGHRQEVYSPIVFTFLMFKFLVPIWTMLAIFQPTPNVAFDDSAFFFGFSATSSFQSNYRPVNYDAPFPVASSSATPTPTPYSAVPQSLTAADHMGTSYARSASSVCLMVNEAAAMRREFEDHSDEDLRSLGEADDNTFHHSHPVF